MLTQRHKGAKIKGSPLLPLKASRRDMLGEGWEYNSPMGQAKYRHSNRVVPS